MSAVTALGHLGFPHPNDQGLRPDYLFQFHEGDRPAWVLDPRAILREVPEPARPMEPIVWIPTLRHMAEELVLMIGVHVVRDPVLIEQLELTGIDAFASFITLNEIPKDLHSRLLERCRSFNGCWKIALTVFEGSSLEGCLGALSDYQCQLEVCRNVFHRHNCRWTNSVVIHGCLEP